MTPTSDWSSVSRLVLKASSLAYLEILGSEHSLSKANIISVADSGQTAELQKFRYVLEWLTVCHIADLEITDA